MTDFPQRQQDLIFVAPKEAPQPRKPPANTVGVIGWLRENLFSSRANSIATVLTGVGIVWFLSSALNWAIFNAEWTVVNNNLRLLLIGQYDTDELWRISMIAAALTFLSGISITFWGSVPRPVFITIIIVLAVLIFVPLISQAFPPPPVRFIVSPQANVPPMRFVGDEGQRVSVTIEQLTSRDADPDAKTFTGFIESTPGATNSRSIWSEIRQGLRTDSLDLSAYDLAFSVALVDAAGNTLETLTSTPDSPEESFSFVLPETGWYGIVTNNIEAGEVGYAWIRLDGVETYTTQTAAVERRIERYGEPISLPCPDGGTDCTTEVAQRALRYEGSRDLFDYFTLQVSPFFRAIVVPSLIAAAVAFVGGVIGYLLKRQPRQRVKLSNSIILGVWLLLMPVSYMVLRGVRGDGSLLPFVPTTDWGGLMLTLVLTAIPMVAAFPIGVLLALGRANKRLVMVSTFCTIFIEIVRGVPLITILFFAKLILPFFISGSGAIELAPRMMIGLSLFSGAYMAEIIRGGLQIVPKGQMEAAQALGLQPAYVTWLITMPQAIRAVIPALMSQVVSLFQDTTLVSIVGLFELLGIVELIVNGQQQYRSFQREAYLFVGLVYLVVSLAVASISRHLESTGVGAARR